MVIYHPRDSMGLLHYQMDIEWVEEMRNKDLLWRLYPFYSSMPKRTYLMTSSYEEASIGHIYAQKEPIHHAILKIIKTSCLKLYRFILMIGSYITYTYNCNFYLADFPNYVPIGTYTYNNEYFLPSHWKAIRRSMGETTQSFEMVVW